MARKADTPENHTLSGVSGDDEAAAEVPSIDEQRASAIENLIAGRKHGAVSDPPDAEADEAADGADASAQAATTDDADAEASAAAEPAAPAKEVEEVDEPTFEIKVNGETRTVTQSELVALAQKNAAGDEYLAEAKAARDEARALREELRAAAKPAATDEPADERTRQQQTEDAIEAFDWKGAAEKIQYADPDEAGAVLQEAVSAAMKAAGVGDADVETIVSQRVNEAMERTASQQRLQSDFNSAIAAFEEKHTEIFNDDKLGRYAADEFQKIFMESLAEQQQKGTPLPSFHQMTEQAAERTYQFVEAVGGNIRRRDADLDPKPGDTVVSLDTQRRQQLKADSAQPASRGAVQRGRPEAPQVLTPEESRAKAIADTIASRNKRTGAAT